VAAAARDDSVFAYHSALQLLGAAHSVFHVVAVFTGRRRRPLQVRDARVEFVSHPTPLVRRRAVGLGVREVRYRDRALKATGPERTLVEGFRKPRMVGGLEELIQSAAGFSSFDLDLLLSVLKAYDQKALWGAAGWFLEQYHQTFRVPEKYLRTLERRRPTSPHYLPRRQRGMGGVLASRWNLVLPESVVSLREPNEA
jgi:predicted transcriptional regulator of viral defense system